MCLLNRPVNKITKPTSKGTSSIYITKEIFLKMSFLFYFFLFIGVGVLILSTDKAADKFIVLFTNRGTLYLEHTLITQCSLISVYQWPNPNFIDWLVIAEFQDYQPLPNHGCLKPWDINLANVVQWNSFTRFFKVNTSSKSVTLSDE